jgi:enediyne biosynthesis protein E4
LRNVSDAKNNWLSIKLVGDVSQKTPRDATGSTVFVTTGKLRQRFDLTSGANYASQDEQTIHVGLGTAAKIDKLEVLWANGQSEVFPVDKLNRRIILKQNEKTK